MNKRRLLKLADLLEADARNKKGIRFDLRLVGYVSEVPDDEVVKLDCGTSACAMGLAALSGAFKREGLSYRVVDGWINNISTTFAGRQVHYDTAAMRLFDIKRRDANFLFTPTYYEGRSNDRLVGAEGERLVAKRIRDFVAGKVSPDGV